MWGRRCGLERGSDVVKEDELFEDAGLSEHVGAVEDGKMRGSKVLEDVLVEVGDFSR